MRGREKATGWKVPLLFCGVIVLLVAIASLWKQPPAPPPDLPPALEARARALSINLDADGPSGDGGHDGQSWKERIVSAGSGFYARALKDERLAAVADAALAAGRLDAACAAAVLVADTERRDRVFADILTAAQESCRRLPWGVFAVRGVRSPEQAARMARGLAQRWRDCAAAESAASPER